MPSRFRHPQLFAIQKLQKRKKQLEFCFTKLRLFEREKKTVNYALDCNLNATIKIEIEIEID